MSAADPDFSIDFVKEEESVSIMNVNGNSSILLLEDSIVLQVGDTKVVISDGSNGHPAIRVYGSAGTVSTVAVQ